MRSPKGQHVVELPANATYGDLKAAVFDKTGIAPGAVELKTGFPPAKGSKLTAGIIPLTGISQHLELRQPKQRLPALSH